MAFNNNSGRYDRGGGRTGFRKPQQGYQRQERREYEPNQASMRPNHEKRGPRDPDYKTPITIEMPSGERCVFFIAAWENEYPDGNRAISIRLQAADASGIQQRPVQGNSQNRLPKHQGNDYEAPRGNLGASRDYPEQRQGGAMARARPIPPRQSYEEGPYDNAPPPTDYPESAEGYNVNYPDNGDDQY